MTSGSILSLGWILINEYHISHNYLNGTYDLFALNHSITILPSVSVVQIIHVQSVLSVCDREVPNLRYAPLQTHTDRTDPITSTFITEDNKTIT